MRTNILLIAACIFIAGLIGGIPYADVRLLSYLIVLALLTFALFDLFRPKSNTMRLAVWIGVAALIVFTVLVPTIESTVLRHQNGPATYVHDNPIQIEAAIAYLVHGKNPYVENYFNTPLADWAGGHVYGIVNPALYHVVALPGHLVLSSMIQYPFRWVFGFYDERMLYLLAYLAMLFFALKLGATEIQRLRSLILVGLNPFIFPFLVEGRNDVLLLGFLLATFWMLHRKRVLLATTLLAVACTIKLFAWVFVPLFFVFLLGQRRDLGFVRSLRSILPSILLFIGITAVVILPFVAWNPSAFYDDVFRYTNGTSATSYPINGYGISQILLDMKVVATSTDYYPFWIFQVVALVPFLIALLPRIYRKPSVAHFVLGSSFLLLTGLFFSRFFNNNYFGILFCLGIAGAGFLSLESESVSEGGR